MFPLVSQDIVRADSSKLPLDLIAFRFMHVKRPCATAMHAPEPFDLTELLSAPIPAGWVELAAVVVHKRRAVRPYEAALARAAARHRSRAGRHLRRWGCWRLSCGSLSCGRFHCRNLHGGLHALRSLGRRRSLEKWHACDT